MYTGFLNVRLGSQRELLEGGYIIEAKTWVS